LENSGIKPLVAFFIRRLRRREKKLKRYLKILACKNGKADFYIKANLSNLRKPFFQALHGQQSKTVFSFLFFCRNSRFVLKMLDPDPIEMKTHGQS
jgi:hypothetical protein